ncbi:NUDIX hydrolase [Candidatus Uhrbacteria bacterium]|nr:NUDIX hydrolase [Candidatus Uhrbacteria bacterium]
MSWKTLSTKTIIENEHLRFLQDAFETENRKKGTYWYHANAYGDKAVDVFIQKDEHTFVMIREYRYLFDRITISTPQGSIEQGESPEEAARREVREEAGYAADTFINLGWFATAPAFSKEQACIFLARNIHPVGQQLDTMEEIDVIEMTAEAIDQAIADGTIWDGQAIAGWDKVKAYLAL